MKLSVMQVHSKQTVISAVGGAAAAAAREQGGLHSGFVVGLYINVFRRVELEVPAADDVQHFAERVVLLDRAVDSGVGGVFAVIAQ